MLLYQYLFQNSLAFQQAHKHPKKLTMAIILKKKWSKIVFIPFFSVILWKLKMLVNQQIPTGISFLYLYGKLLTFK
jgi:hypothetical protein